MEDLDCDRIPKIRRKKLLKRRRRRGKKNKFKVNTDATTGEYSLINETQAKLLAKKNKKEDDEYIILPGVGKFKTRSIYNDDLLGKNGYRQPAKVEKIGGLESVIKRFNLTGNVNEIGKIFDDDDDDGNLLTSRSERLPQVRHPQNQNQNEEDNKCYGDSDTDTSSVNSTSSNSFLRSKGREPEREREHLPLAHVPFSSSNAPTPKKSNVTNSKSMTQSPRVQKAKYTQSQVFQISHKVSERTS